MLTTYFTYFPDDSSPTEEDSGDDGTAAAASADDGREDVPAGAEVEVLNPPNFNIAQGRKVNVNATCGEGGNPKGETYCKLVGYDRLDYYSSANTVIDGQVMDPYSYKL